MKCMSLFFKTFHKKQEFFFSLLSIALSISNHRGGQDAIGQQTTYVKCQSKGKTLTPTSEIGRNTGGL